MRAIDDINRKLDIIDKQINTENIIFDDYDIRLNELFNKALSSNYDFKSTYLKLCENNKENNKSNIYDYVVSDIKYPKYPLFSHIGYFAQEHFIYGYLIGLLNDNLKKPNKLNTWQNELDCFVFLKNEKCIFNSLIKKDDDDRLSGFTVESITFEGNRLLCDVQHGIPIGGNTLYASGNLNFMMSNKIATDLKKKLENELKNQGFQNFNIGIYNAHEKVCHIKDGWFTKQKIVPINNTQKIIYFEIEW